MFWKKLLLLFASAGSLAFLLMSIHALKDGIFYGRIEVFFGITVSGILWGIWYNTGILVSAMGFIAFLKYYLQEK